VPVIVTQPATLPILDLSRFDAGPAERTAFLGDLNRTARGIGFFYLVGHGIERPLVDQLIATARQFFALPEADKQAIEMVNSPHFRGYSRPGAERTRGRPDWREQIDIGAERPALPIGPGTPPWARLQGPNQWPDALPALKPVVLDWQARVTQVAVRLLQAFALALGQPEDAFATIYSDTPNLLLKLIRYPGRAFTEDDQGVGPHKDGGFLTLLLQAVQGGLQVEVDDGSWIDAPPLRGSFIVNIGELLELASDGYLRATVHRVVTPPGDIDRLSVAFFLGANLNASVPLLSLPPDLAAQVRGITRDPNNPLIREVGLNVLKGRLRSHPDVARRHYADLLAAQDGAASAPA
jgi:isopenicillin N synthase-like dioxygenase